MSTYIHTAHAAEDSKQALEGRHRRSKLEFISFLVKNVTRQMPSMLSDWNQEAHRQRRVDQTVRLIEYLAKGVDLELIPIGNKAASRINLPKIWIAQNQLLVREFIEKVLIPLGYQCDIRFRQQKGQPELQRLTQTLRAISKH
jgi:hypothetical protein